MSYPQLRLSDDYAHVEIRKGRGAQRWEEMTEVFNGAASKGKEWKAGEGDKLSGKHCMWPNDASSQLSLPYTVTGQEGLDIGKPRTRVFPHGGIPFEKPDEELILHEYAPSGNCYKIRLTAALLGIPLKRREYDIMKGETRTQEFLTEVNANGRIPVLQIDEDKFLPESNAACIWLACGSPLVPEDRFDHADMLRWMFFEQYNHEPNVATLRFWLAFVGEENLNDIQRPQIPAKKAAGHAALKLMDEHLEKQDWFVGDSVTLADIALYAYTHVAEEGGAFNLSDYPAIERWIARMWELPDYIGITD